MWRKPLVLAHHRADTLTRRTLASFLLARAVSRRHRVHVDAVVASQCTDLQKEELSMMANRFSFVLALILLTFAPFTSRPGFSQGLPVGWFGAGSHPDNYDMRAETAVKHGGQASAHIRFVGEKVEGFGTLMQTFKADAYRGKRLRMSTWMKTQDVDSAQVWMRLDAEKRMSAGFDNMANRPIKGASDWSRHEIVLDVPEDTVAIAFGAFVVGKGQAWVDDFRFEVVGNDVASTNLLTPERMKEERKSPLTATNVPDQAENLNFERGVQPERKVVSVDPEILAAYTGTYQAADSGIITVVREGNRLFLTYGQPPSKFELFPESDTDFFRRYRPETVIFVRNDKGEVTHYIVRLRGQDTVIKKIK
jgi:hypothetical protein